MKNLTHKFIQHEANGNIFLALQKTSSDGDALGTHYINFPPDCDIDAYAASAVTALGNFNAVPTESINQVKALAQLLWTAECIAAYQAAQAAAEAARGV
tara:strand:- start:146 stop:442 length:297 start_codon:yes stop_codon:yes gene_type:complete